MECFKIMITVHGENVIWDLSTETEVESDHKAFQYLSSEINIQEWKEQYLNLYKKWLHNEDDRIYQIANPLNMQMINALIAVNLKFKDFKLCYWFDIDRGKHPDYIWEKCPLSNSDLDHLSGDFHENNKKVSLMFPLVFP